MRSRFQKVMKNQKGMTLVELLAVIVILAIVTAIAVPSISGIISKSKDDAQRSNALMIINAAKLAVVSNNDTIVNAIKSDNGVSLSTLVSQGYLDAVPQDPDKKGSTYNGDKSFVKLDGNRVYSIVLYAQDGTTKREKGSGTEAQLNGAAN
ncbi:prepilin-type N-terminal cleavage/methylation domain-containing protein [Bacillus sp. APMAM]|nr:prepilin-type N-terminal cleavage/methylation domain-containing protein [Bacillus sp. APMAM]RTZ56077.1 prepilin-type N-terminal cleavage/methylation domain-containing protein [Bacillus sp. SAJ1]